MQLPPTALPHDLRLFIDPPPSAPPIYDADGRLITAGTRSRRHLRTLVTRASGQIWRVLLG